MRHLPTSLLAALALCGAVQAQRLIAYDPAGGVLGECQPANVLLPAPIPPMPIYPQVPPLPVLPPFAGDSTFNNTVGYTWVTNGAILAAQPTPMFPPLGPIPPAMPIPAAVLAAIGGGPVTGIAIDSVAGIMYLTGAPGVTIGVAPVAGMPVVVPPFPLPFLVVMPPITGLEWDSVAGNLILCDAGGTTYTVFPGGAPAAPPMPPLGPVPMPVTDVALDRTMALNAFGMRPLYGLSAGGVYADLRDPAALIQPSLPGQGLAFMNHPATNMPGATCICPGTTYPAPGPSTTSPMTNLNAAWGVTMTGLPPGFPVIFGFDILGFLPGFPLINGVGCGLGLTLGPSTLLFAGVADPFGVATYPVPLVPPAFLLGTGPFFNQNATFCTTDPVLGLVLSPVQTLYSCAP
jgi:hypothetical protein